MKKKVLLLTEALLITSLLGCGSSDSSASYKSAAPAAAEEAVANASADSYYDDYDTYEIAEEMVTEEAPSAGTGTQVSEEEVKESAQTGKSERMLIKTVNMSVESEDIDALVKNVEKRVDELGGYIENLSVDNKKYSSSETKTANITARVPVEKLDMFVNEVEGASNVLSRSSNAEDVTLRYVDMQARMESLQTEYDRISELLREADNLDNIIALENRLTEIRYEMQSYGAQLKAMKNQATYSTIYLNVTQVIEYTPVVEKEKTRLERMSEGFISNCKRVWNGVLDFLVGLVVALPVLLIWALVIGVIVFVIRLITRKHREKHPKKEKVRRGRNAAGATATVKPETTGNTNNSGIAVNPGITENTENKDSN